jgi:pimeloyl-ACP methyl ester carboxylesterase
MDDERLDIELADGRSLDVWMAGPHDGIALMMHNGTPMSGLPFEPLVRAATDRGIRSILYSRPGYGGSTRAPERSVADCAVDVAEILDRLGIDRTIAIGWSGGGPHALATAALLPDRVIACASIAGAAPYGMPDLDFLAGMGKENLEEFGAAIAGPEPLRAHLEPSSGEVGAGEIADALGDLLSEVDRAALTADFAAYLAAAMSEAVRKRHLGVARRRSGVRPRLGVRARFDPGAGDDLAGRPGPDGAVRPRRVARRERPGRDLPAARGRRTPVDRGRSFR